MHRKNATRQKICHLVTEASWVAIGLAARGLERMKHRYPYSKRVSGRKCRGKKRFIAGLGSSFNWKWFPVRRMLNPLRLL